MLQNLNLQIQIISEMLHHALIRSDYFLLPDYNHLENPDNR